MKKTAILYTRVSTDEQADRGYSLPHQEDLLRKYGEINNIEVTALFKEDYSAKTFDLVDDNYDGNLSFACQLLKTLSESYVKADLEAKQMIMSSVFAEKLIYENNQYLTPKLNPAITLICTEDKGLTGKKLNQSQEVVPRGLFYLIKQN